MKKEIIKKLEEIKERSAWGRGVVEYAKEMIEDLYYIEDEEINAENIKKILLNGADDWNQYSWGGCSLIYNQDIAERLCNNSELKKTKNGERRPNNHEEWLDVQARALHQASNKIMRIVKELER